MQWKCAVLALAGLTAAVVATPGHADTLKTGVAFNNGIADPTPDQPAGGMKVAYEIELDGGDLDGCNAAVVESLHGRDEGAWGIFDIAADVTCADGGFSYNSSGAWDGNGFHAAGTIVDGSGSGTFEGIKGRVAQLGGGAADAGNGTYDISYDLMIDQATD